MSLAVGSGRGCVVAALLAGMALLVGGCATEIDGTAEPLGERKVLAELSVPIEFLLPDYFEEMDPASFGLTGVPFFAAHRTVVFAPNVTIAEHPSSGEGSLTEIAEQTLRLAETQGADVSVERREPTEVNAGPALRQVLRTQPPGVDMTIEQQQLLIQLSSRDDGGAESVIEVLMSALPGQVEQTYERYAALVSTIRPLGPTSS